MYEQNYYDQQTGGYSQFDIKKHVNSNPNQVKGEQAIIAEESLSMPDIGSVLESSNGLSGSKSKEQEEFNSLQLKIKAEQEKQLAQEEAYTKNNPYSPSYQDTSSSVSDDESIFMNQLHQVESSGGNPQKDNKSGYSGMFQFRYNDGDLGSKYAHKMGMNKEQILANPQAQKNMMHMAIQDYKQELTKNGFELNNFNMFTLHNQGAGGLKAIKSGKLTNQIRTNIRNQGIAGNNDYELIQNYKNKFVPRFRGKMVTSPIQNNGDGFIAGSKRYSIPNANKGTRSVTDGLVIHRTAGRGFHPTDTRLTKKGLGAHITIDRNGTVHQVGNLNNKMWHAGPNWNGRSIGIELTGKHLGGNKWEPLTPLQQKSFFNVGRNLQKRYNFKRNNIVNHASVAAKTAGEGLVAKNDLIRNLFG